MKKIDKRGSKDLGNDFDFSDIPKMKTKASHKFIGALAVVSIIGFLIIVSESLFDFDMSIYSEALLMLVVGIGLIFEANPRKLKTLSRGLTASNFTRLITVIVGGIAIIAGIFSMPQIRIETPGFVAIKGILSIIAIIVIIIQTWIIDG